MIQLSSKTMFALHSLLIYLLFFTEHINGLTNEESKKKVETTLGATQKILDSMFERWKIREYPSFLNSVEMSETSWEILKLKFQRKILKALSDGGKKGSDGKVNKFVVSFLGSSVTAGHDSQFSKAFSEVTRGIMKPAFDAIDVELEVINGAMGNNPCMPYDVCVKTFAGSEADIIHWEQVFSIIFHLPIRIIIMRTQYSILALL